MRFSARRWLVAAAAASLVGGWSAAGRADPPYNPISAIDRPLTLPAHELGISGGAGADHLEDGVVVVTSSLDAAYGITNRLEASVSAINVEYAPTTRFLGPSGTLTYAFFQGAAQIGARFTVGGVFEPSAGAFLEPSLPIRIPFGSRVRLDMGPEVPIVIAARPVVGLIAPFGVTVRIVDFCFVHLDTAVALYDVTARTAVVPARLSLEIGTHVKKVPLSFVPFFAFPTLFTPGDVEPKVHPKNYAGGLGVGTWFRL